MNYKKMKLQGDSVDTAYFRGLSCRLIYKPAVEVNKFPGEGSIEHWWNPDTIGKMETWK